MFRIHGFILKNSSLYYLEDNYMPGPHLNVMKSLFMQVLWIFWTPAMVILSTDIAA
jgi:hypothetical protein